MAKRHFVSGDQHHGITGQLLEIQRQLRMRGGSPLDPEKVRIALQRIIEPGNKEGIGLYEFPLGDHTLDSVLARIRSYGYLDTSFDGREVHPLIIRPLTKEQALDEYRESGGRIWDEIEKNMPYVVPEPGGLNVMILNFGRDIGDGEALAEMDKLDVHPLIYEELIQYGILYPGHQCQKILVGIGTTHILRALLGATYAPVLSGGNNSIRNLGIYDLSHTLNGMCRFLVVPK